MKKLLICIIFSLSLAAGNKVGNGGDGVSCNGNDSIELLDFYENKKMRRFTLKDIDHQDEMKIVEDVIMSLKRLDTKLHKTFKKNLEVFPSRSVYLDNTVFENVEDSNELGISKECKLIQLAIRKKDPLKAKEMFYFSKDAWIKLNSYHKAGLIIHEIVYEFFSHLGEIDSQKVRVFTSFLFSNEATTFNKDQYNKLIRELRISIY